MSRFSDENISPVQHFEVQNYFILFECLTIVAQVSRNPFAIAWTVLKQIPMRRASLLINSIRSTNCQKRF